MRRNENGTHFAATKIALRAARIRRVRAVKDGATWVARQALVNWVEICAGGRRGLARLIHHRTQSRRRRRRRRRRRAAFQSASGEYLLICLRVVFASR